MPDKPMTPEELERNRTALSHIKAWLSYRKMTQRRLAERMDVSEAAVSKWVRGIASMTVSQFVQVAQLLDAKPEELLFSPAETSRAAGYRSAAEIVKDMTEDELKAWISVGASMTKK